MPTPINKLLQVGLCQQGAYDLFCTDMGQWWPLESRTLSAYKSGKAARALSVEARNGGEISEIASDGKHHVWGHFVDCDAPRSVEIAFHMGQGREQATLLVVVFTPLSDDETLVRLRHDGWEIYGEVAEVMRDGYEKAWEEIFIGCYGAACASAIE